MAHEKYRSYMNVSLSLLIVCTLVRTKEIQKKTYTRIYVVLCRTRYIEKNVWITVVLPPPTRRIYIFYSTVISLIYRRDSLLSLSQQKQKPHDDDCCTHSKHCYHTALQQHVTTLRNSLGKPMNPYTPLGGKRKYKDRPQRIKINNQRCLQFPPRLV